MMFNSFRNYARALFCVQEPRFLPAAAWYVAIFRVQLFRATRGKSAQPKKNVPLCRRLSTPAAFVLSLCVIFSACRAKNDTREEGTMEKRERKTSTYSSSISRYGELAIEVLVYSRIEILYIGADRASQIKAHKPIG
jgi:hypothetical protein